MKRKSNTRSKNNAAERPIITRIEEEKIMKAVGRPVKMTYPGPEGTLRGILKSRKIAWSGIGITGALYCAVVDIIKFGESRQPWLRVGYYRQPAGATSPRWASQTTYCGPLSQWRKILPVVEKAMKNPRDLEGGWSSCAGLT